MQRTITPSETKTQKKLASKHGFDTSLNSSADNAVNVFEFHPVSQQEVEKVITSLPSNKAPGHDKITAKILKDSLAATLSIITCLVNKSFTSFARAWKIAEVSPVFKSGDPEQSENN